jgi:hypothetical protein
LTPALSALVISSNYVALTGVIIALGLTTVLALERRFDPRAVAIYPFALMALMFSAARWTEISGFGRTLSPLLLLLATVGLSDRSPRFAAPLIATAAPLIASRGIFLLNLVPSMVRP